MLPYDEAGRGPAVVLLHAGIADRSMWAEHLEPLAEAGYHALAIDLPGFGEADVTEAEQAPWLDILETLGELGIKRTALVGNSFGGAVALRVAAVDPERVSALALISAPAPDLEPSPQLEAVWEAEESALEGGDLDGAVRAALEAWTLADAPPELRERVATMQRRALMLQAAAGEVAEAPDPLEDDPELITRLEIPALITAGERDMADFRQGAEVLAGRLPRARLEVIDGAGHLAPLETPEAFRELLLEFLADMT